MSPITEAELRNLLLNLNDKILDQNRYMQQLLAMKGSPDPPPTPIPVSKGWPARMSRLKGPLLWLVALAGVGMGIKNEVTTRPAVEHGNVQKVNFHNASLSLHAKIVRLEAVSQITIVGDEELKAALDSLADKLTVDQDFICTPELKQQANDLANELRREAGRRALGRQEIPKLVTKAYSFLVAFLKICGGAAT